MSRFKNGDKVRTVEAPWFGSPDPDSGIAASSFGVTGYHEGVMVDARPTHRGDVEVRFEGMREALFISENALELVQAGPPKSFGTIEISLVGLEQIQQLQELVDQLNSTLDRIANRLEAKGPSVHELYRQASHWI